MTTKDDVLLAAIDWFFSYMPSVWTQDRFLNNWIKFFSTKQDIELATVIAEYLNKGKVKK